MHTGLHEGQGTVVVPVPQAGAPPMQVPAGMTADGAHGGPPAEGVRGGSASVAARLPHQVRLLREQLVVHLRDALG